MSFDRRKVYVTHMLDSIQTIEQFIGDADYEAYAANRMLKAAVERYLLTLTETSIRLGDEFEILCPGVPSTKLRHMGNFLRHKYEHIDGRIVWDTVKRDLPPLKLLLNKALISIENKVGPNP